MIYNFNIGFLEIRFIDFIDTFLVSLLLYTIYRLLRGSVAIRIFIGFLILYFFYLIVRASEMELLTNILGQFMGVGVLAVLILFQKEIILAHLYGSKYRIGKLIINPDITDKTMCIILAPAIKTIIPLIVPIMNDVLKSG